jgi:hypothetical protein
MSTSTAARPQGRERSKSSFSFKSHKSHGSHKSGDYEHGIHHQRTGSKDKDHYHEVKPHFTPATKADPNAAMNEVQPSMFSIQLLAIASIPRQR